MPARIAAVLAEGGAAGPRDARGVRAHDRARASRRRSPTRCRTAGRLTGRDIDVIHIVGGGALNRLLCQATADRSGLPVLAGPVEATALGNVLVQARAHGWFGPRRDARGPAARGGGIRVPRSGTSRAREQRTPQHSTGRAGTSRRGVCPPRCSASRRPTAVVALDAFGATNGRTAAVDDPYWLFSITKVLTGLTAARAIERGLLTTETPLSTAIPEFGAGRDDVVRLRHLASHTSGILEPSLDPAEGLRAALLAPGRDFAAGTASRYSTVAFDGIAELVRQRTGRTWDADIATWAPALGATGSRSIPPSTRTPWSTPSVSDSTCAASRATAIRAPA